MTRGVGGHGPANIMKHLKGIHFPASKDAIVSHAQQGPGPDTGDVMDTLNKIPDKQYNSPAEILKEYGNVKRSQRAA
ncbi:MAG: DUF2795 domain-containing protein [Candidatus Aquicultorales bacterium]